MKFLVGFGIGVALGVIFAPASGEQTRRTLRDKATDLAHLPEKKAAQAAESAKSKAGELGARVGQQEAEAAVQSVKDELLGERNKTA